MDVCVYVKEMSIVSCFIVVFNFNCSDLFTVLGFHFEEIGFRMFCSCGSVREVTLGLLRCSTHRIVLQVLLRD